MATPNKHKLPSIEYLNKRFAIDPLTGIGTYKIDIPNNRIKRGDLVKGTLKKANKGVYLYVSILGQQYAWNRICYAIYHGEDPFPLDVDHENLDKLDNSKKNLVLLTTAENNKNKSLYKNNKLGIRGIALTKEGKYRATIYPNKKSINCGTWNTLQEAIMSQKLKKLALENNA